MKQRRQDGARADEIEGLARDLDAAGAVDQALETLAAAFERRDVIAGQLYKPQSPNIESPADAVHLHLHTLLHVL
jgi:hypothetical protein